MGFLRTVPLLLLAAVPSMLFISSCGIDEYAYLEPVTSITISSSDSLKITVKLPTSSEQTDYLTEYIIYYKIYTATTASTSSNSAIASNYSTITTANTDAPTTLESVLKSLSFQPLEYAAGTSADNDFTTVTNPLSIEADSSIAGQSFTVDFDLNSLGKTYPILTKADGTTYKLLRYKAFSPTTDQDLTYHSTFLSSDGDTSYISGFSYAYVVMYIVATGYDTNFSRVFSTATRVNTTPIYMEDRD